MNLKELGGYVCAIIYIHSPYFIYSPFRQTKNNYSYYTQLTTSHYSLLNH